MIERILLLSFLFIFNHVIQTQSASDYHHFLNEWAVHIPGGGERARAVAEEHGYEVDQELLGFEDHYLLVRRDVPHRSKRNAVHHTLKLQKDKRVNWVEQQTIKRRSKRDFFDDRFTQVSKTFNDPLWNDEWYLHDRRGKNSNLPKEDLHVIPVWKKNITGNGVVVTVLDDGLEWNHPDLITNYDPKASYDFNEKDADPMPRYDSSDSNRHGTRCGGEIAMVANNGICGVGVAFNAKLGGIKMLDGRVTDSLEGQALAYNCEYVDVYSASWGPTDNGKTLEAPGKLAGAALKKCVTKGRKGKGSIFVWASGNGGRLGDNCDCDGYTGSPYTLSVSSASEHLQKPWYGERCASTMATTYSSGRFTDRKVATTDLHKKCTKQHSGTSAAAPLAAGIIALLLEQNPSVTWRDVQHLVAWTSQPAPLQGVKGWYKNAKGFLVNTAFGFGLMDAANLVQASKQWKNVPDQHICRVSSSKTSNLPQKLKTGEKVEVDIKYDGCKEMKNEVNHLEHVIVEITVDYPKRGALSVEVTSPSGTKTMFLEPRRRDRSDDGYHKWPLMSIHTWGEDPHGVWKIIFKDETGEHYEGTVRNVELVVFGTENEPDYMKNGPRHYNFNYNKVENERQVEAKTEKDARRRFYNQLQESLTAASRGLIAF